MRKFKFVFFLIGSLAISNLFAQNINYLDEKKGFKVFTLGDPLSKWSPELFVLIDKMPNDSIDHYMYYMPPGNCCETIFDYRTYSIFLTFYKDKLVEITIDTDFFKDGKPSTNTDDYLTFNNSLAKLFGTPTTPSVVNKKGYIINTWQGKKVILVSEYGSLDGWDRKHTIITFTDFSLYEKLEKLKIDF